MNKIIAIISIVLVIFFKISFLDNQKQIDNSKEDLSPTSIPEQNQILEEVFLAPPKEVKTIIPTPVPTKKITVVDDNEPWGVSKQIGEKTWTIKLGQDAKMATPNEIFLALNEYRKVQGSQVLNWDQKLGNYAQERAVYLNKIQNVDQHKGFNDFVENQDGFNKLGFTSLGENISFGYKLNGVHTIEWMYAGDKPHNDNQLNNKWNYVGIGVDGLATCLIFATGKF